jgi:hypothetical protein
LLVDPGAVTVPDEDPALVTIPDDPGSPDSDSVVPTGPGGVTVVATSIAFSVKLNLHLGPTLTVNVVVS